MIKNYLTTALRIMMRHRGYSIINLAGLTIGITCSLLIALYIFDELQYDGFHRDADRIYRVGFKGKLQGNRFESAQTGAPLAAALQSDVEGIASTLRLASWATFPVRYDDKVFTEEKMLLADSNFFSFFDFQLLAGDPTKVLKGAHAMVISESAARRYFNYTGIGDPTPLGKTLVLAQGYTAHITGIAADPPLQSHVHFTFVLSLDSWEELKDGLWTRREVNTYLKLKPESTEVAVNSRFSNLVEKYCGPELQRYYHTDLKTFRKEGNDLTFFTQPLKYIHLRSHLSEEIEQNGNLQYIYLLGIVAVFIIILACINFMNLSTARSANRAREVGVRKAVGAQHNRLVSQFLLESYLYTIMAVVIALLVVKVALVPFNILVDKQLTLSLVLHPLFLSGLLIFILFVGLMAGSYPAFYLTSFAPAEVLKGRMRKRLSGYGIRNVLVVFQFFISISLIIATLVVYKQLQHIQHVNLGFDHENIINLLHTRNLGVKGGDFKQALLKNPDVISASYSNRLPPRMEWQAMFRPPDSQEEFLLTVYEMDFDHLKTLGYEIAKGRFFDPAVPGDTSAILLNESAARQLKLENFAGQKIISHYDSPEGKEREVIGILRDFNFQSLHHPIQAMAIIPGHEPNWEMAIRVTPGNLDEKIDRIKSVWKNYAPQAPFEYTLLDANFNMTMKPERLIGQIFLLFTCLSIFIAGIGLYGLANYTAMYRSKEMGIRKAMGATVAQVVFLMSKDFARLVGLGFLLAAPLSWFLLDRWLGSFAYRTNVDLVLIGLAGASSLVIALGTISYQAWKSALANPVDSLRDE